MTPEQRRAARESRRATANAIFRIVASHGRRFSEGGTLLSLCMALRDYILHDKPIPMGHFGKWPEHLCGGDLWGYGFDEMEKVRSEVTALMEQGA